MVYLSSKSLASHSVGEVRRQCISFHAPWTKHLCWLKFHWTTAQVDLDALWDYSDAVPSCFFVSFLPNHIMGDLQSSQGNFFDLSNMRLEDWRLFTLIQRKTCELSSSAHALLSLCECQHWADRSIITFHTNNQKSFPLSLWEQADFGALGSCCKDSCSMLPPLPGFPETHVQS